MKKTILIEDGITYHQDSPYSWRTDEKEAVGAIRFIDNKLYVCRYSHKRGWGKRDTYWSVPLYAEREELKGLLQ